MNALMRRLPPGSFLWLLVHEVRMSIRARRSRRRGLIVALILLAAITAAGIAIGRALRDVPIEPGPQMLTGALVAAILMLSFMTTQSMLGSQRTLYEAGDLDLLLSAPIAPRRVLTAKLCGIAASVVLSFFLLLMPIVVPVALQGHIALLGIPATIVALALLSAALGFAVTLGVARIAGPRGARTFGQVVAALLAGAVFLTSQFISRNPGSRRGGGLALFQWFSERQIGASGWGALPGRAAFGDPLATLSLFAIALACFAATGLLLGRAFLAGYQNAGMRLSRRKAATGTIARRFRAGLAATMFAKEWTLIARDPALAFQIVLRLIYLAPIALAAFGQGRGPPLAPALAFASVIVAGQLVGSFAWLAISAEDAPDLIAVAPVEKRQVERAKLLSALALATPMALIIPAVLMLTTPPGALITLAFTAAGGTLAGLIELKWRKPAPRKSFARRRSGSIVAALATLFVTALFGGGAALAVWLVA
jgi:ABC-2 type transport system permease protein